MHISDMLLSDNNHKHKVFMICEPSEANLGICQIPYIFQGTHSLCASNVPSFIRCCAPSWFLWKDCQYIVTMYWRFFQNEQPLLPVHVFRSSIQIFNQSALNTFKQQPHKRVECIVCKLTQTKWIFSSTGFMQFYKSVCNLRKLLHKIDTSLSLSDFESSQLHCNWLVKVFVRFVV